MKNSLMLLVLLFLGGCAMGQTTNYQGRSNFKPEYKLPPIALAVIDQRAYVVDGTKTSTYVGTLRSIGGVPYNINTASGRPLAEMLQQMLVATLAEEGYAVDNMMIFPIGTTENEAAKTLTRNGTKALLLLLREWRSHIYFNPIFVYDLKMLAINSDGEINASTIKKGEIEFSENKKIKTLAEAISTVFGNLFNDQTIKNALLTKQSQQSKQPFPEKNIKSRATEITKCTADQVLNMKSIGMTDDQINAACN